MTGGFLLAVVAVVLAIVIAAPQYAEPAADAAVAAVASTEPIVEASTDPGMVEAVPTSASPDELKGYRWPVRGGSVDTYYQRDKSGRFEIGGKRVHDGLVITWFEGAVVKAAHGGTVVAAGRDWVHHAGYSTSLDEALERFEQRRAKLKKKDKKAAEYPEGVVIDDGNGYFSIYTELKALSVAAGDEVKRGQTIGQMTRSEGKQMMRYRLVRMDGPKMKVDESDRQLGYPLYACERVDPMAVLKTKAKHMPKLGGGPPDDPPRLSDY